MSVGQLRFIGPISIAALVGVGPALGQQAVQADHPGIRYPAPFAPSESRFHDIQRRVEMRWEVASSDGLFLSRDETRALDVGEIQEWDEQVWLPSSRSTFEGEIQVWHGYHEENEADSIGLWYDVSCELETVSGASETTSEIGLDLYWTETIEFEVLDPYRLGVTMSAYGIEGYATSVRLVGPGVEYRFDPKADDAFDAVVYEVGPAQYRLTLGLGIEQQAVVEGEGSAYIRVRPDVRVEVALSDADTCNAADIARPFGVLDAADISLFLEHLRPGWPETDLAAPEGVWDMQDVVRFLELFGEGCSGPE